jgi:hypothetical protein
MRFWLFSSSLTAFSYYYSWASDWSTQFGGRFRGHYPLASSFGSGYSGMHELGYSPNYWLTIPSWITNPDKLLSHSTGDWRELRICHKIDTARRSVSRACVSWPGQQNYRQHSSRVSRGCLK